MSDALPPPKPPSFVTTTMPAVVSLIILGVWAYLVVVDRQVETVNIATATVIGYWLGSSLGSWRKDLKL